jgi:hypothetical protein
MPIVRNVPYDVTRYELQELGRAIADSATEGFVKILTVPGKDRILGVTIVGKHAGDLLAEFVLAMKHGLGLAKVLGTIHIYPTLAEANKSAAGKWRRAHAPHRRRVWGRFDVDIRGRPWMLKVIAVLMNWRSRISGIATGDQAIFVARSAFESVGGFPDQPLIAIFRHNFLPPGGVSKSGGARLRQAGGSG